MRGLQEPRTAAGKRMGYLLEPFDERIWYHEVGETQSHALLAEAHSSSARRRGSDKDTHSGLWCAGVTTAARAPGAALIPCARTMPSPSTGTGTALMCMWARTSRVGG